MKLSGKLKNQLVIILTVIISFNAQAGKEKYSNNASTKAGSTAMLTNNTVLIVQDPYYTQYASTPTTWKGAGANPGTTPGTFFDKSITNRVIFSIDYSDIAYNGAYIYTATVNFNVIYSVYNNSTSSFQNLTQAKTLTISSNQATIDKDKAVFEFTGGNNLQVQVTGVSFSNSSINFTNARVQLEAEIELERYYFFNPAIAYSHNNLSHCSANMANSGELDVFWKDTIGAEEYELEWVFLNNYGGFATTDPATAAASITFDEKLFDFNATRITTANHYYKIPYIYERGYILYRVRAVGRTAATGWAYNIPGRWSTDMYVTSPPTNVGAFLNKFPSSLSGGCNTGETFFGLNEALNWQSSTSYAEEGKSKAVVNFNDGSLRSRQSITKLKSKNDIIIGETIYDFQGRPAVNVLPVPSNTQKIQYTANFNMLASSNVFDAADFDYDNGGNCGAAAPALVNTAGASNYYSANNPTFTAENALIPDAQGYPYTQTEYTPDNTGRIRNQSGVGINHVIGSGHETKYYYGAPEQKDLDRLFGSEVGDGLRYKKNMVIDANGQPSITYLDPLGKTIATSLAGNNPANLDPLVSQASNLTTYDLLNKTLSTDKSGSLNLLDIPNKKVSLSKTLLVPSNGPYTFTYQVIPPTFTETCGATLFVPPGSHVTTTGNKCYDCVLDTKISLKNECGEELLTMLYAPTTTVANTVYNFTTTGNVTTVCGSPPNATLTSVFTPTDPTNTSPYYLKPGSYVLEKSLSINQPALDLYTKNYLDTLLNPCILKLSDFKNAQNLIMDVSGCGIPCSTCVSQLGGFAQYDITTTPTCTVCLTIDEYNALLRECNEMCSEKSSKCENALAQLLADMSPSGQYGQYSLGNGGSTVNGNIVVPNPSQAFSPGSFPLSIFNETSNQLPFKSATDGIFTAGSGHQYSGSHYAPNWRHPYNATQTVTAKQFAYLDEFYNIVYINLTPNAGNYLPAVDPTQLGKVIITNGQAQVEPRYLQNFSDFLTAWDPQWAYSLIAHHPEYIFYQRCLQDTISHDFDASYIEKDAVSSSTGIATYVATLGYTNADDFMYPVGRYSGSSWSGSVIDPYFATGGNGVGQLTNIRNSMVNYLEDPNTPGSFITIWDAAYRIVNCPNGGSTGICPSSSIPSSYTFNDLEWQTFRGLYESLKQTYQDRVNIVYGINNEGYNQCIGANPFDAFENNFYDPNNNVVTWTFGPLYSFWNGSPFFWNFPFGPFWAFPSIHNLSQYNNPEQTCNSNRYYLYANKQARFPTMKMLMPDAFGQGGAPCYDDQNLIIPCPQTNSVLVAEMGNQADMALYQSCGQCPTAVNFQQLIKALATLSTNATFQDLTYSGSPGVKLTCAPNATAHKEFTPELFNDLFGSSVPTSNVYWQYDNVNSNPLFLRATLTHNATTREVAMQMPSLIVPSPAAPTLTITNSPLLTNYMPFNNMYSFNDVIDICCVKYNQSAFTFSTPVGAKSGNTRFTALVTVTCKSGDPLYISSTNLTYRQIAVEGNVQNEDFKNCSFNNICKPSDQIKRVQNLLNALLFKNPDPANPGSFLARDIDNTSASPIKLTNNATPITVYDGFMQTSSSQPSLIKDLDFVIAPSSTPNNLTDPWYWSGSSTSNLIVGTLKPQSSSPATQQCTVSLQIPAYGAGYPAFYSSYSTADLIKLTGVKPVSGGPTGAFTIYGLFRKTGVNSGNSAWLPLTGTISCLSAGSCGQEVSNNFALNQGSGESNNEFGYQSPDFPCNDVAPAGFLNHYEGTYTITSSPYYSELQAFTSIPNGQTTYVGTNAGCSYTLTIPTGFNFNQVASTSLANVITTGGGVCYSFYINATTTMAQSIVITGVSSCPLRNCPLPHSCSNVGNILINSDFEEGNYGFYSDFDYTPNSSLAMGAGQTPSAFPPLGSVNEKKYNVYAIKPTFNATPPTFAPVWISDHTGVLNSVPPKTYFSCDSAGNGNALAARNQKSATSTGNGPGLSNTNYVWYEYVNLAPNQPYNFTAYFRGVPDFTCVPTVVNTIVGELYINGVFQQEFYNAPSTSDPTLPLKSWKKMSFTYNSGTTNLSNVQVAVKIYYATVTSGVIQQLTGSDGRKDDLFLLDDISFEGCMLANSIACNVTHSLDMDEEDDCTKDAQNTGLEGAEYLYQQYLDSLRKAFQAKYVAKCLNTYEDFFMKCNDTEHHFTLYYYDQAGNLVKTIPPQGVNRIPDGDPKLQQIKLDRQNNTQSVYTTHTYATNYKYNSLNQLVSQSMPDNNDLAIWNTNSFLGVNSGYNIQSVAFNGTSGFLVANAGGVGHLYTFNSSTSTWVEIPSLNVSTLNSVVYIGTSSTAFAVGKNGTILNTVNNGTNWSVMPFSDGAAELIKVCQYLATGEVIVFDRNGNRYISNPAGTLWTKTTNVFGLAVGETLKDVEYDYTTTTPTGIAISNLNRIYTYNGTNWILNNNNYYQAALNKVAGDGSNIMYAAGKDGTILRSTNSGLNWIENSTNISAEIIDMNFYNASSGYLLDNTGIVYQTSNSGSFMFSLPTTIGTAIDIDYFNGNLFALTTTNDVYQYSGGFWSFAISPPGGVTFKTINAITATTFYAGTNNGVLYFYNGSSYSTVSLSPALGATEVLKQIDIKLSNNGYILTQAGLLYYKSGGTLTNISGTFNAFYYDGTNCIAITSGGDIRNYTGTTLIGLAANLSGVANFKSVYLNTAGNMVTVGNNTSVTSIAEISVGSPFAASPGYSSKSGSTLPVTLNAVTTNGGGLITGNDGTVAKFNSANLRWETQITNTNTQLNTISANGSNIVAAGVKGVNSGFNDIVYFNGSSWNKTPNTVDDYYASKIVGTNVYFTGANRKIVSAPFSTMAQSIVALTPATTGPEKLLAVNVNNTGNVNVVGESGLIYYGNTSTATQQGNINPPVLNDIKWFDNTHLIAVGNNGQVIASDNAGAVWKVITLSPTTVNNFNAVDILNATTAIAVGDNNTVYQISFSCASSVCAYTAVPYATAITGAANLVDIEIKNNELLTVDNTGKVFYKTVSAGWTTINTTVSGLKAISFVDNTFAFAVGASAAVVKINPSAPSYVIMPSLVPTPLATAINLNAVYFKDYTTGYAVGNSGTIVKTTNGGSSWLSQTTPTSVTTNNLNFVIPTSNNSFVVGGAGGANGNAIDNKDEMSSRFYYDKLGRLVASQNSRQYAKNALTYSYTRYDNLGRIIEVGEVLATTAIESLPNTNNAQVDLSAFNTWLTTGTFSEITKTYYTDPIVSLPATYDGSGTFTQTNLRNRVSYTTYADVLSSSIDHATYYSYDVHGNVNSLYQYNNSMIAGNKFKRVDYEYDLISGKVNAVYYQKGAKDQYSHKYDYDDDNRITNANTSKDGVIWDQDAKYFYYRHGPLARTELGDNKVQGEDFAYTLQGWIKGVNSDKPAFQNDQGADAIPLAVNSINNFISRDAVGYHLGYFAGDYKSINQATVATANYFLADKTGSPLLAATKDLYNGNISEASYTIKKLIDQPGPNGGLNAYRSAAYNYDQLNRLVATANFNNFDVTNNKYTTPLTANAYNEQFTYDDNGNILTLQRKDDAAAVIDNLTYKYNTIANSNIKNTNQLGAAQDAISTPSYTDDIETGQVFTSGNHNYDYDNIGNLIKDTQEQIANVEWTVYGKIKRITRTSGSTRSDLEYNYDAGGNRISKVEKTKNGSGVLNPSSQWVYTYYTRDAQGNVMSTYQVNPVNSPNLFLTEQNVYGSSRLGVLSRSEDMTTAYAPNNVYERFAGNKNFELSNHLGNVLSTVSDRKIAVDDGVYNSTTGAQTSSTADGNIDYHVPDITTATDYYAFGSPMPKRQVNSPNYRYGFNGKENDNEVKGSPGSQQDYGSRIYDSRLGRWLSLDPMQTKYPDLSPYNFVNNNPMLYVDPTGEDYVAYLITIKKDGSVSVNIIQYWSYWPDAASIIIQYEGSPGMQTYDFTNYGTLGHNNQQKGGSGNNLNQFWTFVREFGADPEGTLKSKKYITQTQMQIDDIKAISTALIIGRLVKQKASHTEAKNKQHAASNNGVDKNGVSKNSAKYQKMKKDLAKQEMSSIFNSDGTMTNEAISKSTPIMNGTQLNNTNLKNNLTADGSSLADWNKMSYTVKTGVDGKQQFDVHYYYNSKTQKAYYGEDYKSKEYQDKSNSTK